MATDEKDKQHILAALVGALTHDTTFNNIWLVTSKSNERDEYEPVIKTASLIVNPLPKLTADETKRNSILISYFVLDGKEVNARTFGHILEETDEGIDEACDWIAERTERAMSDLLNTTYNVRFAVTEHVNYPNEIRETVERVAMKMLGKPSNYDLQYNLPDYIAAILRVKGEHPTITFDDYFRQIALTEEIFQAVNDIR